MSMKKKSRVLWVLAGIVVCLLICAVIGCAVFEKNGRVAIDEEHFPDAALREAVTEYDQNQDGILGVNEANKAEYINVHDRNVTTLQGIEYLRGLKELSCYENELTELDLSRNTRLERLNCLGNQLTKLDVSRNTELVDLNCNYNQIESLDISHLRKLEHLLCYKNHLTELNISDSSVLAALARENEPEEEDNKLMWEKRENGKAILAELRVDENVEVIIGEGQKRTASGNGNQKGVRINSEHFPDMELWKTVKKYDRDDNGYLSREEAESAVVIDLQEKNVESLKGIEHLTALETLNCENNKLTELDLSQNTELKSLNCGNNQLTALNVKESARLENLSCERNKLTELDLSGNPALVKLECGENRLAKLDLSQNTNLVSLYCIENFIEEIDLSRNTELTDVYLQYNRLKKLDVSGCLKLTELYCSTGNIEELNVSRCPELKVLHCYDNALKELDLSRNLKLKELYCSSNKLTELDISKNAELEKLFCFSNNISELDISSCPDLQVLNCENCALAELDISGCKAIADLTENNEPEMIRETLEWSTQDEDRRYVTALVVNWSTKICKGNGEYVESGIPEPVYVKIDEVNFPDRTLRECVSRYDLSGDGLLGEFENSRITKITLGEEKITTLKGIEYLTALTYLYCDDNELTELDVSRNTELTYLSCNNNKLKTLDLSQNTQLTELYCYGNELTELDLSRNTELTDINCARNKLAKLDVGENTKLEELQCNDNQIPELNVNNHTGMKRMIISRNQLTKLDTSGCHDLEWLWCDQNRLAELDVSTNPELRNLLCRSNGMRKLIISNNTRLEELECTGNQLTELDISSNPVMITLFENGNPTETDEGGLLWITRYGWGSKVLQTDKNVIVYTGNGTTAKTEKKENKGAYPEILYDDIKRILWDFFCKWAQGDADNMPESFMPEQRVRMEKTKALVRELMESGIPLSYQINTVEGKTGDDRLKYTCTVLLDHEDGTLQYEKMIIELMKVGTNRGVFYYIDPDSLTEHQEAENDPTVKTILLDKETILHDQLAFYGKVVDELQPIGASCEDNGIRIELLAAVAKEKEVYFYYTIKDLEGKYADYSFYHNQQLGNCWGGNYSFSPQSQLYYDRKEHQYYFLEHLTYMEIESSSYFSTFGTSNIQFNQNAWADCMALMKEYGESTQYTQGPDGMRKRYYADVPAPEGIKILDCSQSEEIRLLPNTVIKGIGWIDDQLHVQVCMDEDMLQSIRFDDEKNGAPYGSAEVNPISPLRWETNGKVYVEYIFDYKREQADALTLYAYMALGQVKVKGDWHIEFTLDSIREKTKPAEQDCFPEDEAMVWIDEASFPDNTFREEIRLYDMDGDGWLSETEAEAITSISLPGTGISTLKGIEYLTQLTYLDCSDNRLTDLDLSNNRELVTLLCTGNSLTELDVSNNPELVEFEWEGKKLE